MDRAILGHTQRSNRGFGCSIQLFYPLYYGPLLLGYKGEPDIDRPKNGEIGVNSPFDFHLKGNDIVLSPVYHLMDAKVRKNSLPLGKYSSPIGSGLLTFRYVIYQF